MTGGNQQQCPMLWLDLLIIHFHCSWFLTWLVRAFNGWTPAIMIWWRRQKRWVERWRRGFRRVISFNRVVTALTQLSNSMVYLIPLERHASIVWSKSFPFPSERDSSSVDLSAAIPSTSWRKECETSFSFSPVDQSVSRESLLGRYSRGNWETESGQYLPPHNTEYLL